MGNDETKMEPVKRPWKNAVSDFPFELAHMDGPANNMEIFHWHDFMELSYVKDGAGTYEIEDKVIPVAKGDVVIINNIEKHRVTYPTAQPLYETVIHFHPSLIWMNEDLSRDYQYLKLFRYNQAAFNNRPQLCAGTGVEIQAQFCAIAKEYTAQQPFYELMIKSRLLTIITLLLRDCGVNPINDSDAISRRNQIERLDMILQYIKENFAKGLSLETTARRFYMNASYFSDYFKKNVGINFSDFLAKARVHEAIRLMGGSSASITEITYAVGFNNPTSFYNAFKKVTGLNPGDYKKKSSSLLSK